MKRCPETGKLLPHPIKVGDCVVALPGLPIPGITPMKGYKVKATSLSKPDNQVTFIKSILPKMRAKGFIIEDDDGLLRRFTLGERPLSHWEKVKNV